MWGLWDSCHRCWWGGGPPGGRCSPRGTASRSDCACAPGMHRSLQTCPPCWGWSWSAGTPRPAIESDWKVTKTGEARFSKVLQAYYSTLHTDMGKNMQGFSFMGEGRNDRAVPLNQSHAIPTCTCRDIKPSGLHSHFSRGYIGKHTSNSEIGTNIHEINQIMI